MLCCEYIASSCECGKSVRDESCFHRCMFLFFMCQGVFVLGQIFFSVLFIYFLFAPQLGASFKWTSHDLGLVCKRFELLLNNCKNKSRRIMFVRRCICWYNNGRWKGCSLIGSVEMARFAERIMEKDGSPVICVLLVDWSQIFLFSHSFSLLNITFCFHILFHFAVEFGLLLLSFYNFFYLCLFFLRSDFPFVISNSINRCYFQFPIPFICKQVTIHIIIETVMHPSACI